MELSFLAKARHARPCAGHDVLPHSSQENVDGRDKPGYDETAGGILNPHPKS
jgi:hypothetical protein